MDKESRAWAEEAMALCARAMEKKLSMIIVGPPEEEEGEGSNTLITVCTSDNAAVIRELGLAARDGYTDSSGEE